MLTGGPTFRASSQAQQSQAGGDVSQAVRDAIANDPNLLKILAVEMFPENSVKNQVIFLKRQDGTNRIRLFDGTVWQPLNPSV